MTGREPPPHERIAVTHRSARIPTKQRIGVNIRLLDDIDVKSISVSEIDGRNLW